MSVVLYGSPTCPRCKVLEKKMERKNLSYIKETDEEKVIEKGLKSIPWIELEDGTLLDFKAANDWINQQENEE